MMYPLVLDLADGGVPVTVTCRVLGFSTQAFYKWRKAPVSQRDWEYAHLTSAARDIHADDPAFGYRFIADELPRRGITAGENRVARLCSQEAPLTPPATRTRQAHPDRVRTAPHTRRNRALKFTSRESTEHGQSLMRQCGEIRPDASVRRNTMVR